MSEATYEESRLDSEGREIEREPVGAGSGYRSDG
jgi:hypothetical protein